MVTNIWIMLIVSQSIFIGKHELWAGCPAKFVKMVEPEKAKEMNVKIATNYHMYSKWYGPQD